ncbi:hypothetical protein ACI2OX_17280 [Bacillus sp. N9]
MKIEGDVGADPIWCNKCGCNLDIDYVPISDELAEELSHWATKYGEWIDWDKDRLLPNGIELEDQFNQMGIILTKKYNTKLTVHINGHLYLLPVRDFIIKDKKFEKRLKF